jgi:hypothetical protein
MLSAGLIYIGSLKLHKLSNTDRYYVYLPPVPAVHSVVGRRPNFVAQVLCSGCDIEGLMITFKATVTAVRRRDGDYWFRVMLPARYRDIWGKIVDRGQIKLYISLIG